MLVLSSADTPLWVFFLSAVISSVGIAILGGMPNACALKTVPAERSGAASGAISTISNLGAAMSLVLMVIIFVCIGIMNHFADKDSEEGIITL